MKIYIVKAFGGQWEDSWESDVIAVKAEQRAKELVEQYQKESDEHDKEMMWYKDNPGKVPEHLSDVWFDYIDEVGNYSGFFECSETCKACEVDEYFPSDSYLMYDYTGVDMEEIDDEQHN